MPAKPPIKHFPIGASNHDTKTRSLGVRHLICFKTLLFKFIHPKYELKKHLKTNSNHQTSKLRISALLAHALKNQIRRDTLTPVRGVRVPLLFN